MSNCIERFFPSKEQKKVYNLFVNDAVNKIEEMFKMGLMAFDSIVTLPHENEDGSMVRHGANNKMAGIAENYAYAAAQLGMSIDRDLFDLIRYKHRFIAGQFVSQKFFDENYSQVNEEIERLEKELFPDPNDGVPEGYEYIESYYPYWSSAGDKILNRDYKLYGFEPYGYDDVYSKDKKYYSQFVSSGHERDSSGDHYKLYKKKEI